MLAPRPIVTLLVILALTVGACDVAPVVTPPPASAGPTPEPTVAVAPTPSEAPFEAARWPETGSACGTKGYTGRIGQIDAPNARTVRFSLCEPDGAFLARLAHPALAIYDTTTMERLAADRASARSLAGTGPYRIDAWVEEDNVRLARVAPDPVPGASVPTVILRWADDATQRTFELLSATVDGIDAPGALDLDRIATAPELSVMPRDGLATAYLGFGTGAPFNQAEVRQAIAAGINRDALATAAFPPGSRAAVQVTPCVVEGGCAGEAWHPFDAPAASAALQATDADLEAVYPLHVPDRAVPGLPDPEGAARAVAAHLEANLGLRVEVDTMPVRDYEEDLAAGRIDGLYLGGVASTVADPGAFLEPLFGSGVKSTPAKRARGAADVLERAAATPEPAAREAAYGQANDAIRDPAVVVPLVHPGSVAVFRSDVTDVRVSPLGLDPLGMVTPGDRRQVVFLAATQPDGAYCGDQGSRDAYRLCGLVTEGLYGFGPGTLALEPRLAEACGPNADATTWTCRLRDDVAFHDGARLDAGDVLATFVAQWDRTQPLRASSEASFGAWNALFGDAIE
jgi:ABC-type transport system substrate-binding protein